MTDYGIALRIGKPTVLDGKDMLSKTDRVIVISLCVTVPLHFYLNNLLFLKYPKSNVSVYSAVFPPWLPSLRIPWSPVTSIIVSLSILFAIRFKKVEIYCIFVSIIFSVTELVECPTWSKAKKWPIIKLWISFLSLPATSDDKYL